MNKLCRDYLLFTFGIMVVFWGTCLICSYCGILLKDNYALNIPIVLGGWSPTIASFIALRKNKKSPVSKNG